MAQRESVKVVEKFDLNQLILDHIEKSKTDESFFIVDIGDVVRKFILWRDLMPRIDPDFAFKCNNHPSVVGTLAALGKGLQLQLLSSDLNKFLKERAMTALAKGKSRR